MLIMFLTSLVHSEFRVKLDFKNLQIAKVDNSVEFGETSPIVPTSDYIFDFDMLTKFQANNIVVTEICESSSTMTNAFDFLNSNALAAVTTCHKTVTLSFNFPVKLISFDTTGHPLNTTISPLFSTDWTFTQSENLTSTIALTNFNSIIFEAQNQEEYDIYVGNGSISF